MTRRGYRAPAACRCELLGAEGAEANSDSAVSPSPTIPLATDEIDIMTAAFRRAFARWLAGALYIATALR